MRQHKILTWTLLSLSIIYFALAAPVTARKRPDKRWNPSDERGSTKVPWPDHAPPPSLDSTSWEELMRTYGMAGQMPEAGSLSPPSPLPESGSTNGPRPDHAPASPDSTDSYIWRQIDFNPPYSPDSLGLLKGWDYVPPNPGSPTGSRLPVGSPVASSLSPPPPESGPTNVPGPGHAQAPSLDSTSWEELMRTYGMAGHATTSPDATDDSSIWRQIDPIGNRVKPPYSPDGQGWDHVLPSLGSPSGSQLPVGSPVAGSLSPPPPPESGQTNVPGPDHAPLPSPDSTDSIWWQTDRTPPHSPDNLGSLTGWNYVPPNPGSPTRSRLLVGSMPVASSHSPPPESGSTDVSGPNHAPPLSPDSTDSIWWQTDRTSPYSPDSLGSLTPPNRGSPTGSRLPVGSMPVAYLSPPPPPSPHPSHPGPSEDHSPRPSGFSVNPDTLPSTGSTGNPPTPPQGPGVDSGIHHLLNPEPIPTEFDVLDKILKDKIKRHISGSML